MSWENWLMNKQDEANWDIRIKITEGYVCQKELIDSNDFLCQAALRYMQRKETVLSLEAFVSLIFTVLIWLPNSTIFNCKIQKERKKATGTILYNCIASVLKKLLSGLNQIQWHKYQNCTLRIINWWIKVSF